MTDTPVVALSTCPNEQVAQAIAEALVSEGLAACVNQVANVRSTYFWDGRLQNESEILLIIKTVAGRLQAVDARLKALHPYDLPELVALEVIGGNERYLDWVRSGASLKIEGK